ncbi:MAG: oligosaccharide flippase family protein [Candidatus Krumholzibacteriia bacterium]
MRFSDYLTETFWAAVDKALPLIYGFGYIFLVARVLPKTEFGWLAQFEIVYYFILMLDLAIAQTPMAKFTAETKESVWAIPNGYFLSFVVLSGSGIACVVAKESLANWLNAPGLQNIILSVPVLLAAGYFKTLSGQICVARNWTGRLVVIDAVYFLGSLTLLMIMSFLGMLSSARQVIWANIYLAAAASLVGVLLTFPVLKRVSWRLHREHMKRFLAFSRYSLGAGFGAYLNGFIDVILVSRFLGTVPVGIYRAGKIIYRFYNAFSQAAQVIILPLASRFSASGQMTSLRALYEKSIYFSYLLLLPLNAFLLLSADWIVALLYSGKYPEAVPVFRWLLIGAFFLPWGTVGINILLGADKPKLSFRITWIVVAVNMVCSYFFIKSFGVNGAAMVIGITSLVGAILTTYYIKSFIHFTWRGIIYRHVDVVNYVKTIKRS